MFYLSIESGGMWQRTPAPFSVGPALYKTTFTIHGKPCDTFADMTVSWPAGVEYIVVCLLFLHNVMHEHTQGWGKGILIINGANLGRYWSAGPQRTLYVPAPILRTGVNKVNSY